MNITFPEHLGLDLIVNKDLKVKHECWVYAANSSHSGGASVYREMKLTGYFYERFKSTEGAESKFPVIIAGS